MLVKALEQVMNRGKEMVQELELELEQVKLLPEMGLERGMLNNTYYCVGIPIGGLLKCDK